MKESDGLKTIAEKQTCFENTDIDCVGLQNGSKARLKTNGYESLDDDFRTNATKKVDDCGKSLVEKGKKMFGELRESRKKDRSEQKPLPDNQHSRSFIGWHKRSYDIVTRGARGDDSFDFWNRKRLKHRLYVGILTSKLDFYI